MERNTVVNGLEREFAGVEICVCAMGNNIRGALLAEKAVPNFTLNFQ